MFSSANAWTVQNNSLPVVVILGDSNTWLGGDDCRGDRGWSTWFGKAFATRELRSYARSGATWTISDSTRYNTGQNVTCLTHDNVAANQIYRLKEAIDSGRQTMPDIVLLALGTNDAWFVDKRCHALESNPLSCRTIDGAVRYNLALLGKIAPGARLVVITPLQSARIPEANLTRASQLVKEGALWYGADIIDLHNLSPIHANEPEAMKRYTTDSVHTSIEGARCNGEIVARELKKILLR